ncbi:hypothetical protein [Streptomyces sp. TLI_105]|uniref:hypothetical protein n=1 Tax=Streptomyces sp. TLI_105 TaxID=1881019 RepID=UPI00089B436C|nr:hypothetical protein [Streptomyces sp. TLI_105]SEE62016.1 hypothetical protein SAMN05428939_8181 [Streptomyces sp. TLI_105]
MEGTAAALEVLAGSLAQLDPECAEILSVVPAAAAAVVERAEQAAAGASESVGGRARAGTSAALRQALAAHGLTRHRVHQLGAALVTVTLDAPEAQALAVLLSRPEALPRQAQQGDDDGWGAGPAETAAAALADALHAHGTGAYARHPLVPDPSLMGIASLYSRDLGTSVKVCPTAGRIRQRALRESPLSTLPRW